MEKIDNVVPKGNKIIYKKGDLFTAPPGSVLLHACNCKGKWGSGVAVGFKAKFPAAFREYVIDCEMYGNQLLGSVLGYEDSGYLVTCMYTSRGYGANVDSPREILEATKKALADFLPFTDFVKAKIAVHSPKINSGFFRVPWERTEALINEFLSTKPTVTWTVWDNS